MTPPALGVLVHSFFADGLLTMKGLRPASVRSYRDVLRLFLRFVAHDTGHKITRLALGDLSFERVLRFVRYLEDARHNQIRTRNQRVACLHTFFDYLAGRVPEFLEVAERVAAIPMKRVPPPETRFLEREDIDSLFATLPTRGARALRDRALLLFLYNTGARVQEAADLHVNDLDLAPPARVPPARQRRQMADVPAVGGDGAATPPSPRSAGAARSRHSGVRLAPGARADTLRHLQARAPPDPPARDDARSEPTHQSPRVPPHDSRPSLGSRRRDQCHPGLAGPRQPRHYESLRRDQHPREGGRPARVRTTRRRFGGAPPEARLAQ